MVNALELFENFKNNQTKRALMEEQLRLAPLQEERMRFSLAKDQAAMNNDAARLGILSRQQQATEEYNRGRLGVMAQVAKNRGALSKGGKIIQTDEGIFEMGPNGLIPLKSPTTGEVLRPKGSAAADSKASASKEKELRSKALLDSTLDAEINNINKLIGDDVPDPKTGKARPEHPGLNASVGVIASRIPTLRQDTADAEALQESLRSKASISALQTIRGTAGAIGTLTEKEWPRLEALKATLQASQGTPQFRQSLKEYRDELRRIKRLGGEAIPISQKPSGGSGGGPLSFATEAEANAAGLQSGTKVIINGVSGTWQ